MSPYQVVPARSGVAVALQRGQIIKIINTHGKQVVDTFAFSSHDPTEFMSMSHTRTSCSRLVPAVGQSFVSSKREPMLTFLEDTSPGVHDSLIAACDANRYRQLGSQFHHANCSDNLRKALNDLGVGWEPVITPDPLNLFMNIPISHDFTFTFERPKGRPGDFVKFKAEMDLVVAMSACPMDLNDINGREPTEAHFALE